MPFFQKGDLHPSRPKDSLPMGKFVGLVGCGKAKLTRSAPAADLYTGGLTKSSIAWMQRNCTRFFILSAKWGLVPPGKVLKPYNVKMDDLDADQRKLWKEMVRTQMKESGIYEQEMLALCGSAYLDQLTAKKVHPMCQGMKMGYRLKWLKENPYLTKKVLEEITGGKD